MYNNDILKELKKTTLNFDFFEKKKHYTWKIWQAVGINSTEVIKGNLRNWHYEKKIAIFFDMENLRKIRKIWINTRNGFWLASYFNLENNEKKKAEKKARIINLFEIRHLLEICKLNLNFEKKI